MWHLAAIVATTSVVLGSHTSTRTRWPRASSEEQPMRARRLVDVGRRVDDATIVLAGLGVGAPAADVVRVSVALDPSLKDCGRLGGSPSGSASAHAGGAGAPLRPPLEQRLEALLARTGIAVIGTNAAPPGRSRRRPPRLASRLAGLPTSLAAGPASKLPAHERRQQLQRGMPPEQAEERRRRSPLLRAGQAGRVADRRHALERHPADPGGAAARPRSRPAATTSGARSSRSSTRRTSSP